MRDQQPPSIAGQYVAGIFMSLCMLSFGAKDACNAAEHSPRPNFIFILADDLGYGDLGCYGRTDIQTPNLDRLAEQGVSFTNHYANGAECTPTRAAFLTGRYQQWIGGLECAIGTGNVGRYDDAIRLRATNNLGLPVEENTIAKSLQAAGYATALCGKWHLGYEPKFAPRHHGFDHSFYCIGGEMDYFHFLDPAAYYNLFRDGQPVSGDGYFTDLMTDDAIEFLKQHQAAQKQLVAPAKPKPFFLFLAYTCPHSPFQGPDDRQLDPLPLDSPLWKQGSAPPKAYLAMIEQMDRRIGDLLQVVETMQIADKTIVFFASDNGGTRSARNDPLSGIKGSTFEGGIRVPGMIRWPGRIAAGTISDQACMTFDFTRSIAELAGVPADAQKPLEGIDIVAHIVDQKVDYDRTLFWRKQRGNQVWKAVRDGKLKYVANDNGVVEKSYLFDLSSDIAETENLKPKQAAEFERLQEAYSRWESKVRKNRRGRPVSEMSNGQ